MTPTSTLHLVADDLTRQIRALRAQIVARRENVPNLRDYGLSDAQRERYERDIAEYHAETGNLNKRMQALGHERQAELATERAGERP